jgi:glycerol-3-phosphate dehydrogenase
VRYLKQGNLSLVIESLRERAILRRNAPHLVRNLPFVVPTYAWWQAPFYGAGLRIYHTLAGRHGFGRTRTLTRRETIERVPTVETRGLRGGVVYHDGQFDDARLVIHLAATAADAGATLLNYMPVTALTKRGGLVAGAIAVDAETGTEREVAARVVINATGAYTDGIRRLDDPRARPLIRVSQGVHVVLDSSFLPSGSAILVPHTRDGRVLFAVPWHGRVVVGTTDTPVGEISLEPRALDEELEFLLASAARYLVRPPARQDLRSVFAGLRPLVERGDGRRTSGLSRDHTVEVSRSGLVTITGGKWTTYRLMAEDAVDQAIAVAGLEERPSVTARLTIHGGGAVESRDDRAAPAGARARPVAHSDPSPVALPAAADAASPVDPTDLSVYGTDAPAVARLLAGEKEGSELLHPDLPVRVAHVIFAARSEMARTVEDVLARRTRALLLDSRGSVEMAPRVAAILARELGRDESWQREQIAGYDRLARGYRAG